MCLTTFYVVLKFTPCAKMFLTFTLKIMTSKIINNTVSIPIRIPPRIHTKSYCPLYLDGNLRLARSVLCHLSWVLRFCLLDFPTNPAFHLIHRFYLRVTPIVVCFPNSSILFIFINKSKRIVVVRTMTAITVALFLILQYHLILPKMQIANWKGNR